MASSSASTASKWPSTTIIEQTVHQGTDAARWPSRSSKRQTPR